MKLHVPLLGNTRLFTLAPEAKALFRGNMDAQRQALARMLESLVYGLSRPEHLALGLRDLGRRHAQYGVQPAHYGVLRQALLETLAVVLRERYTPAVKQAWASTLDMISHIMLEGAAHRT